MKETVFVSEKFSCKSHTLIASLNMNAHLVFADGEIYPAVDGDGGREVNDSLLVRAGHKSRVLNLLSQALEDIG